jgi:cytochrome P450
MDDAISTCPYADDLQWPPGLPPLKNIDDDGSMAEPYAQYAWMRKNSPVLRLRTAGEDVYVVTRYDDVKAAARKPDVFSSRMAEGEQPTFITLFDAAEHRRLRHVYAAAFNPKSINLVEDRIKDMAQALVGDLVACGSADATQDVAVPLTMATIGGIMDVPSDDIPQMKFWSNELLAFHASNRGLPSSTEARHNTEDFFNYLQGRLEELYAANSQSVGGHLARTWKEGHITAKEARELCAFLFMAGHDTTTYLIGNAFRVLLEHPDLLARLRNRPDDCAPFVEEVARLRGPVHRTHRRTTRDAVIANVAIPAGAVVRLVNASANRDDAKFTDPDTFDIDRDNSGHVGFGFGVHSCIGAPLARLEARTLLRTLARQVSGMRLAGDDPVRLTPGHAITLGPTRLSIQVSGMLPQPA